jgi:hypothetical protein
VRKKAAVQVLEGATGLPAPATATQKNINKIKYLLTTGARPACVS